MPIYFTFSLLKRIRFTQISWCVLLLSGLACRLAQAPATPTPPPTAVVIASPSPQALPASPTPAVSPSPSPQPTPSPDPQCAPPSGAVPTLAAAPFNAYGDQVLRLLNAGIKPEALRRALEEAGIASQPSPLLSGDLDGDGKLDLALSIFDPQSTSFPPASAVIVFRCEQGTYRQVHRQDRPQGSHLWHFADLNASGGGELVVSWAQCGVATCFEELQILEWDGAGLANRLQGSTAELAFPLIQVADHDQDGFFDLEISASSPGSVGAGPPRNSLNRWTYRPESRAWLFAEQELSPSNFRVHVLQDAETAAKAGRFEQALADYQRVILDDSLQDWADPLAERQSLQAYARFRIVVVFWRMQQPENADQAYQELRQSTPGTTSQIAFAEMAGVFLKEARAGGLEQGCTAVEAYANAHTNQVLLPLNSFGYATPGFTAADLCP